MQSVVRKKQRDGDAKQLGERQTVQEPKSQEEKKNWKAVQTET